MRYSRAMVVSFSLVMLNLILFEANARSSVAGSLRAGAAKVDITDRGAGPVNDPLYVKALVVSNGETTVALVTVDAVAIGEIGPIKNDYLQNVRVALQQELRLDPTHLLVNASHCHGRVCQDVDRRTVQAVREAAANLVPVRVAVGVGKEDRVSENRRLRLKNGREADVRRAYPLPPDDAVAGVGPIDPEIGLLRLDRTDGSTLAVVYNFACHPIQGVPGGGNTADLVGYASRVLEEAFGNGCLALFLQGCAGDINPVRYKDVTQPHDAEPLGNLLGLSALRAAKRLTPRDADALTVVHETIELPRCDNSERIASCEREQLRLLRSLRGTSINLKDFLYLVDKPQIPGAQSSSHHSHRYLQDDLLGSDDLKRLDAENRRDVEVYLQNIYTMEELVRLQTNLALLKTHHARNAASDSRTIQVGVTGLRIDDFRLITFPGELSVSIGLNIKQRAPREHTFVAGYTNGYIYYAPTAEQLQNVGGAQEDSDCLLAPEWQAIFEAKAAELLERLK